jgi:uncharacterized protein (TIGR00299 family) protein
MKHLHFDILSGIAGDMTVAALTHLGAPLDPLVEALAAMGLIGVRVEARSVKPSGINALRFLVELQTQSHSHRNLADVRALLDRAGLPALARERADAVFCRLAEAEGKVHGLAPEAVTFHEVGAEDSIADVVGCALALEHLAPDRITASQPLIGTGITRSQHGPIPVPAPATLELLRGVEVRSLDIQAELTTPTGAAVLTALVDAFGPWPAMRPLAIGYGAGSRELPGRPNLLRVVLGEAAQPGSEDEIQVEANIDDMSPEHFEHLMDALLEAGAHDVWLTPVQMKKSRPAVVVSMLCDSAKLPTLEQILFSESTTIGLRRTRVQRRKLARHIEHVSTPWGSVRIKVAGEADVIYNVSPEYEDCRALAKKAGVPLAEVYAAAMAAHRS